MAPAASRFAAPVPPLAPVLYTHVASPSRPGGRHAPRAARVAPRRGGARAQALCAGGAGRLRRDRHRTAPGHYQGAAGGGLASLLRPVGAAEGAPREDRCALRGGGAASSPCGARCVARGARRPPERLAFPHARVLSRFERRVGARACGGAGWSRSVEGCVRGHSIPWHARVPRQARVIRLPPELTSATWRLPSAGGAAAGGRGRRWSRQLDAGGGTRACVSGWRRARAVQRPERGAAAAGDVYDGADGHLPLAERLALGVGARGAAAADGGEGGLRASGGIHRRVRRDAGGPDACAHAGEGGGHRGERVLGRRRSALVSTSALAEPGCHKRGGCASVRSDTFGLVSDAAAMGKKIRFRNQVDAQSTALTEFYPMHPSDAGGCAQAARGAPQLPRRV